MRVGIIDIGTNTFHLLIVDKAKEHEVLHKEKVAVRIGANGISKGYISDDALDRAIETLSRYKKKLTEYQVDETIATATSAVRNAENKHEFVQTIRETTGIEVQVLSGQEEALLIYQGVKEFVSIDEPALIMDIGGGSVEFIIGDSSEVKWLSSYEIGGQRIIDKFHKSDPINKQETERLHAFLKETLQEVFQKANQFGAKYLIGSSGSFDTFWDIYTAFHPEKILDKPELNRFDFEKIHDELISKTKEERLQIPGMIEMRVDMIVGASIMVKHVMENCHFDEIRISPFALKEGLLYHGLPKKQV